MELDKTMIKAIAEMNGVGYREVELCKGGSIIDKSGNVVKNAHSELLKEMFPNNHKLHIRQYDPVFTTNPIILVRGTGNVIDKNNIKLINNTITVDVEWLERNKSYVSIIRTFTTVSNALTYYYNYIKEV